MGRQPESMIVEPPERWRDIPELEGRYQASTRGQIRRMYKTREPKVLRYIEDQGTCRNQCVVNVYAEGGRRRQYTVLRLVAMAFYPGQADGKSVIHRNGLHHDNSPRNVLILDASEAGKRCGRKARRKTVCMLDGSGEVVEAFPSVTAASAATGRARETIRRHCDRMATKPLPDGTTFRWDDEGGLW